MPNSWSYEVAFSRNAGLVSRDEQQRLHDSRVAIVGMGGVGGIHLVTLGRLGIGKFSIADFDCFNVVNFNRQYGARLSDLKRPKVEVMAEEIRQINPHVDLRIFDEGVKTENIGDFLDGADLFVDGIDFFAIDMRRQLFREAARRGIYAVTAAPLGFSTAWLTFDPRGMSFDEYFDLHDDQSLFDQLVAFAVGLAPKSLHFPYFNWGAVNLAEHQGPSSALACQLCAGVVAAEAVKVLLGREKVRCAPCYAQFDAYRGLMKMGRLWLGNRHPMQRRSRARLRRMLLAKEAAAQPAKEQRTPDQKVAAAMSALRPALETKRVGA